MALKCHNIICWGAPVRTLIIRQNWLVSSAEDNELDMIISQCENMLTLLGSHPACFGNKTEADATTKEQRRLHRSIWCSINYRGSGFPVFIWTKSNADNISANATNSGACQLSFTNTSLITRQLQANESGVIFYSLITFPTPNPSTEKKTNVLEYTWKYSMCKQSINDVKWSL